MRTDELDFHLPPELIAQSPIADRAASRLLHYQRSDHSLTHRTFSDLPSLLRHGDLLVFNDAKVIPARFRVAKKHRWSASKDCSSVKYAAGAWLVLLKAIGKEIRRDAF